MNKQYELQNKLETATFLLEEAEKNWDNLSLEEKLHFIQEKREAQRQLSYYTGQYVPEEMKINI